MFEAKDDAHRIKVDSEETTVVGSDTTWNDQKC